MSPKTFFLMGAPTAETLDWDKDKLLDTAISPFNAGNVLNEVNPTSPDGRAVKWRSLQGQQPGQSATKISPDHHGDDSRRRDSAVTNERLTSTLEGQELSLFYNHSFSIHETSEISTPGMRSGDSFQESGQEGDSTGLSIETSSGRGASLPPIPGGLCDLKDIPNAGYLRSIIPQTMTVNIIVGIITIYPPRRVMTRQWQREQEIVEMVVADETRTGFNVTFWVPTTSGGTGNGHDDNTLGRSLAGLRPRDIVLLRMVGLSSFRERVYGQSLRKGVTRIDLLHRKPADVTDTGGVYSLRRIQAAREGDDQPLTKVRRVREWIKRFVEEEHDREMRHPLPPDTQ